MLSALRWRICIAGGFGAFLSTACSFDAHTLPPLGDGPAGVVDGPTALIDALVDATPMIDARPACWPWTPTNFDPCTLPASNGSIVDSGQSATLDTTSGTIFYADGTTMMRTSALIPQANGPMLRVFVYDSYTLTSQVNVIGQYPLLVMSKGSLEVSSGGAISVAAVGEVDGSSRPGPGGSVDTVCGMATGPDGKDATQLTAGGGGGTGGAFGAAGGQGGAGTGVGTGQPGGPSVPPVPLSLSPLRGGCSGGKGGETVGGKGGGGGGALQLEARDMLTITDRAVLNARGAGGQKATSRGGGGGGGSGGGILLEASVVKVVPGNSGAPLVCANGGSGGEGGGLDTSANGSPGSCDPAAGATTADLSDGGGNGGAGGFSAVVSGAPGGPAKPGQGSDGFGGGGGGAGVGVVVVRSVTAAAVLTGGITPAAIEQR